MASLGWLWLGLPLCGGLEGLVSGPGRGVGRLKKKGGQISRPRYLVGVSVDALDGV